jgi:hypothetical protein
MVNKPIFAKIRHFATVLAKNVPIMRILLAGQNFHENLIFRENFFIINLLAFHF